MKTQPRREATKYYDSKGAYAKKHASRQLLTKDPVDAWNLLTEEEQAVANTLVNRDAIRDLVIRVGDVAREAAILLEHSEADPSMVSRMAMVATTAEQAEIRIRAGAPSDYSFMGDLALSNLITRSAITCSVHLAATLRIVSYISGAGLTEDYDPGKFSGIFGNAVRALLAHSDFVAESENVKLDPIEAGIQKLLEVTDEEQE